MERSRERNRDEEEEVMERSRERVGRCVGLGDRSLFGRKSVTLRQH